ncbi:MAG: FkbM family methyltransferase [Pseudomarimonas sp.]
MFKKASARLEGHDFDVLRSLSLSRFRPRVIVIEIHDFMIESAGTSPVVVYLRENRYSLVGFAVNGFFVDQDSPSTRR